MQKKIIALAVAAALTAPAMAFAEATVYGKINMSYDMVDDGATTNSQTTNQLVSNNSRIGFKGSEDLGGGMSAIWQMEATVGMDNGTGASTTSAYGANPATTLFDRNTWLGVKTGFGTLMAGRNDTVYKTATRRLDVFGDQLANDNRKSLGVNLMGSGYHNARLGNSLNYVSPKLGDAFSIAVSTVFGAEAAAGASPKKGDLMSLAAAYDQGPIYAALAYQTMTVGGAGTGDLAAGNISAANSMTGVASAVDDEATAFKLGGSFKMDAFTIGAEYEDVSYTTKLTNAETTGTNMYLAGTFNFSPADKIKLSYTVRGATETASVKATNEATAMAIGYDHAMSKNTTVYASYTTVDQEVTGGADPSAFNIGMVTSF
jgi:predicted porin